MGFGVCEDGRETVPPCGTTYRTVTSAFFRLGTVPGYLRYEVAGQSWAGDGRGKRLKWRDVVCSGGTCGKREGVLRCGGGK